MVADDVIVRRGLIATALRCSGEIGLCATSAVSTVLEGRRSGAQYDYAVVLIESRRGLDRLTGIDVARALLDTASVRSLVAVARGDTTALVQLRAREAGFEFLVPYEAVSSSPDSFLRGVTGSLPEKWRLATQWELREHLGYRWTGSVSSLLGAAALVPNEVWTTDLAQQELPVDRRTIRALREAAAGAGLPAPDFRRYATSTRSAPVLPEWSRVRSTVRQLWGREALQQ